MKESIQIRSRWLTIRLNEQEERILQHYYSKTTCNALSEYARNVLLKEPVSIRFRNESAESFLEEMLLLKKELNAIGNNFNQAVHRLHTLDHDAEIKTWAMLNENTKNIFMNKVDEILLKMNQIYELWSQE